MLEGKSPSSAAAGPCRSFSSRVQQEQNPKTKRTFQPPKSYRTERRLCVFAGLCRTWTEEEGENSKTPPGRAILHSLQTNTLSPLSHGPWTGFGGMEQSESLEVEDRACVRVCEGDRRRASLAPSGLCKLLGGCFEKEAYNWTKDKKTFSSRP